MIATYDPVKEQAWIAFQNHDCMQEPSCKICYDFGKLCIRTGYTEGKVKSFTYDPMKKEDAKT